ncbi:hypothetical protein [Nonlabens sp.]|uniref:hypothetical protein n=1 Tax=Nonlabens sp. TaxID=1888209 RepID=UPI003F6A2DE8
MNIWILKYSKTDFSSDFINKATQFSLSIDQLRHNTIVNKRLGDFHFISISTNFEKCQKKYIQFSENSINGYSGLLLGKHSSDIDLRTIENVTINHIETYSGQFSIFKIIKDRFECIVDNFGFHKVFYFKHNHDIYVTNSIDLLKK